jgi:hypothetical protein
MTVPNAVAAFIDNSCGVPYCDACIQGRTGLSRVQQVQQITSSLGTTAKYFRERGECDGCGKVKKVIWAR